MSSIRSHHSVSIVLTAIGSLSEGAVEGGPPRGELNGFNVIALRSCVASSPCWMLENSCYSSYEKLLHIECARRCSAAFHGEVTLDAAVCLATPRGHLLRAFAAISTTG